MVRKIRRRSDCRRTVVLGRAERVACRIGARDAQQETRGRAIAVRVRATVIRRVPDRRRPQHLLRLP